MKENRPVVMAIIVFGVCIAVLLIVANDIRTNIKPTNNLQQEQINLDSIKTYTTHITDSLTTINVEYKAKIEAKNEVIRTLKGLVNDNNKKYQVISDSALVVELERLRGIGIR